MADFLTETVSLEVAPYGCHSAVHYVSCAICMYIVLFQASGALQWPLAVVCSAVLVVGLQSCTFPNDKLQAYWQGKALRDE